MGAYVQVVTNCPFPIALEKNAPPPNKLAFLDDGQSQSELTTLTLGYLNTRIVQLPNCDCIV